MYVGYTGLVDRNCFKNATKTTHFWDGFPFCKVFGVGSFETCDLKLSLIIVLKNQVPSVVSLNGAVPSFSIIMNIK